MTHAFEPLLGTETCAVCLQHHVPVANYNTVSPSRPGFRNDGLGITCIECGCTLLLGRGMDYDPEIAEITRKHMELCEGNAAETLKKVERHFRALAA